VCGPSYANAAFINEDWLMRTESPLFGFALGVFFQLFRRAVLRTAAVVWALIFVPASYADTNFFPVLNCQNRAYTNATIESVTPATVTIFWDGGGERIPITNLPPELLSRYHYDPQAAQAYLDEQAAKRGAAQERAQEQLAAMEKARATVGPSQKIRIVKILSEIHFQIEAEGKVTEAYIHKLPPDFFASLSQLNQAKAEESSLESQIARDQSAAAKPAANSTPGVRYTAAQKAAANAQKNNTSAAHAAATEATAALAKVKSRVKELEAKTTISASPTDFISSTGIRQWEYQASGADGLTAK
jgi:hypothetical protein